MLPEDPKLLPGTDFLFHSIQDLRDEMRESHLRLRVDMNAGFDKIHTELRAQYASAAINDKRITVIETLHAAEDRRTITRPTWVAIMAAGSFTGFWKLVDWLTGA